MVIFHCYVSLPEGTSSFMVGNLKDGDITLTFQSSARFSKMAWLEDEAC